MHDFPDFPVKKTSRPFICRAASTDLAACSSSTSSALRSLPAKGSAWHWHAISSKPQKSTDFGWVKRHTALAPGSGRVSEVLRPNLEALLFMLFLADLAPWLIQGQKKEKHETIKTPSIIFAEEFIGKTPNKNISSFQETEFRATIFRNGRHWGHCSHTWRSDRSGSAVRLRGCHLHAADTGARKSAEEATRLGFKGEFAHLNWLTCADQSADQNADPSAPV